MNKAMKDEILKFTNKQMKFMKEILKIIKKMDRESYIIKSITVFSKENFKMEINLLDYKLRKMVINMKAISKMTNIMDMAVFIIQVTDTHIKANDIKVKNMDLVSKHIKMVLFIRVSL